MDSFAFPPRKASLREETATSTQLKELKGEIDAIATKIENEKAKWETEADPVKAAIYLASIADLRAEKTALIADRSLLLAALVTALAPGKNPPLAFCGTPSPCMRTPFHSVFVQQPPPCLSCVFQSSRCVC